MWVWTLYTNFDDVLGLPDFPSKVNSRIVEASGLGDVVPGFVWLIASWLILIVLPLIWLAAYWPAISRTLTRIRTQTPRLVLLRAGQSVMEDAEIARLRRERSLADFSQARNEPRLGEIEDLRTHIDRTASPVSEPGKGKVHLSIAPCLADVSTYLVKDAFEARVQVSNETLGTAPVGIAMRVLEWRIRYGGGPGSNQTQLALPFQTSPPELIAGDDQSFRFLLAAFHTPVMLHAFEVSDPARPDDAPRLATQVLFHLEVTAENLDGDPIAEWFSLSIEWGVTLMRFEKTVEPKVYTPPAPQVLTGSDLQ